MGRSRGNFHVEEDHSQRSRRKRGAALSGENTEFFTAGHGTSDGKRALFHCNYCNKDITGRVRIKCAVCSDFDLCIDCFSVGVEVHPHKSDHPYRVMDNLSFPLICPEWNADEEILLLEGIEMYGMGNWAEVAEHVGTKTKEVCIDHYRSAYLNSPYFPLPDMTHVAGKNRKELLAMAKRHLEDKKGELLQKDESLFSTSSVKVVDSFRSSPSGRLPSTASGTQVNNRASNMLVKDQGNLKMEGGQHVYDKLCLDPISGKSFVGNKPTSARVEPPSLAVLSGYNPKRQEFDIEYDNDAEQLLADMEFKETDTAEEHELKLRVLRIYSKRLDERKRRKDFILERDLLNPRPFERGLSQEEKDLCRRYDVFMRFHSKEEHEELLKTVVDEYRILKRIQELKEARDAGCRTSGEADRYLERKRREAEGGALYKKSSHAGQANTSSQNDMDSVSMSGVNLLTDSEKQLCREIRLAPSQYLKMQEEIAIQIFSGNITKKSDAHLFFQIEPTKVDRVYDMVLKKGIDHQ